MTTQHSYTVHVYSGGEYLFGSDVFESKTDAQNLIDYMLDENTQLEYVVYKNKPLRKTTRFNYTDDIDEDEGDLEIEECSSNGNIHIKFEEDDNEIETPQPLSGMTIEVYGRGYILIPPSNHPKFGRKYFYDAWWNKSQSAWFFKKEFLDKFISLGAEPTHLLYESEEEVTDSPYDLTGMSFTSYGKGYLLCPQSDYEFFGEKYFMNGWWKPELSGWFFKQEFFQDLIDAGAALQTNTSKSRSRSGKKSRSSTKSATVTSESEDLEGMVFMEYGKGLLLKPTTTDERWGTKYFLSGWWRPGLDGWFFKYSEYERLENLGAKFLSKKKKASKNRDKFLKRMNVDTF